MGTGRSKARVREIERELGEMIGMKQMLRSDIEI